MRAGGAGDGAVEKSRERARIAWLGGWSGQAEGHDPYHGLACGGDDSLTRAFEELAVELVVPLVEAQP